MSVRIAFVLAELTQPEALALVAMLKSYDQHAIADQVKSGGFEDVAKETLEKLGHVDAAIRPSAQAPGEVPAAGAATGSTAGEPAEKPRRGRPKKEEVAATQVDPFSAAPSAEEPKSPASAPETSPVAQENAGESTPTPSPEAGVAEVPTLDDLRNALLKFTDKNGVPAGLQMLKVDFNCARVSDVYALPIEKQLAFIQKCHA